MDSWQEIDEIVSKKKVGKRDQDKAIRILLQLPVSANAAKDIAETLMKLHFSACSEYFEGAAKKLDDEQLVFVVNAFTADEQFQGVRPQSYLYPKGYSAAISLLEAGKFRFALPILNAIIEKSEKKGQITEGGMKAFKKYVEETGKLPFFEKLYKAVEANAFHAKPVEKMRFEKFWQSVRAQVISKPVPKEAKADAEGPAVSDEVRGALGRIAVAQNEMLNRIRLLTESARVSEELAAQLKKKDEEIAAAQRKISERNDQLEGFLAELKNVKETLNDANERNADLTNRLRKSLSMDEISKNQELITLKNDISVAMKPDYRDFTNSRDKEFSQGLFEVYRSMLSRLFRVLKRHEIELE